MWPRLRPYLVHLIWLSLFALVLVEAPEVHLTPEGILPESERSRVMDTMSFDRRKAFLVESYQQWYWLSLACKRGPLWVACGEVPNLQPIQASVPMGASAVIRDGSLILAGMVKDSRVTSVVAAGVRQEMGSKEYFLFSWATKNPNSFLPAVALDASDKVLYELQLNSRGYPEWHAK